MSRTYRKSLDYYYYAHGQKWTWDEIKKLDWQSTRGWQFHYYLNKKGRDRKPWDKPTKEYKQIKRRIERANIKLAVYLGKEVIPFFKKSDQWDWT